MQLQKLFLAACVSVLFTWPTHGSHYARDLSPRQYGVDSFFKGHAWIPASNIEDARRSPCPLLNTLANHGFLFVHLP
jgi:hypothetical protein